MGAEEWLTASPQERAEAARAAIGDNAIGADAESTLRAMEERLDRPLGP